MSTLTLPACEIPVPDAPHDELVARARAARDALGPRAVVLGHHYQKDEVMAFADITGDSYLLARRGAEATEAELLVFCGVYFMAEAADVLARAGQSVVLPDLGRRLPPGRVRGHLHRARRLGPDDRRAPGPSRRAADLHELGRGPEGVRG